MDLKKYIGEKIKELRGMRNMSQEELAEDLETTKQTVSRYENGKRQANQDVLFKLSSVFDVSIDYFFPQTTDSMVAETTATYSVTSAKEYNYYPVGVAAGLPENISSTNAEKISIPDSIMGKWAGQDDIMVMRINGQSMNKTMPDQSLIAVKPTALENLKDGDIVVYSDDHEYSVKRMYKQDGHIVFRPHSTDIRFTDYIVSTKNENLVIYGKVVVYIVEMD